MFEHCHVFPLNKYAEPAESTVEDLIGPRMYTAIVDLSYKLPRRQRLARTVEPIPDEPVLKKVSDAFGLIGRDSASFDPMIPAECLFKSNTKKIERLSGVNEAMARFETLFAGLNAAL